VAAKIAIEKHPTRVRIVNAFIADEDADNRRFLADCEKWFGVPIVVLRDTTYNASPLAVWRKVRFIVGQRGAPCSMRLKRDVLAQDYISGDTIVLGYTADKQDAERLDRYIDANPEKRVWAPLIEAGITKKDCFDRIEAAGLLLPRMYMLGYHNANCPLCPKGGMGYWNKIRVDFPENYEAVAAIQDVLGPGSYFFRNRITGERISLRELDPKAGRFDKEKSFECGAVCEVPK
jgi:hypothetical protein